jgi:hypothetical protein
MLLDEYDEEFAVLSFCITLIGNQLEQSKLKEVYLDAVQCIPPEEYDRILSLTKANSEALTKRMNALRKLWPESKKRFLFHFTEKIVSKATEEIPYSTRTSLMYYCLSKLREHW